MLRFCLGLLGVVLLAGSADAGVLFRNGSCYGGSGGCQGRQAGCLGRQASSGCEGRFGGGRFREVYRVRGRAYSQPSAPVSQPVPLPMPKKAAADCVNGNCTVVTSSRPILDALEEVNALRRLRGLLPFRRNDNLTVAAQRCAEYRAARRIDGHTSNDFQFIPPGESAVAAGSGALEPSWGWGTCCTFDGYQEAGAAYVMGDDGKRYMQLFVK